MRACVLRTAIARAAWGRVSGPGLALRNDKEARAPANVLGLNDSLASRNGPR